MDAKVAMLFSNSQAPTIIITLHVVSIGESEVVDDEKMRWEEALKETFKCFFFLRQCKKYFTSTDLFLLFTLTIFNAGVYFKASWPRAEEDEDVC